MNWDELYARGINVENISRDSQEFEIMFSAALHKIPSAQYCLGLWNGTVNEKPDVALLWLRKAAQQGFMEAIEAIRIIENEEYTASASITENCTNVTQDKSDISEDISADDSSAALVIQEHNFQKAKNSLLKYTEQATEYIELSKVPSAGGLFKHGDHKVTGDELNRVTSQIQDYLIRLNTLSQGLVDEFGEVYKAFESLDKDYISGIVASIKAAEKVSKDEQNDREDIRKLVEQHEQSVAVLTKFKADIDNLKQFTNKEFSEYMAELSIVEHLKDVDIIYTDFGKLKEDFSTFTQVVEEQSHKSETLYQSLEQEMSDLNEQVNTLTQRTKLLSIVSGGVAALSVIHLLLNILGVF